jgi:HEAT repeat protein
LLAVLTDVAKTGDALARAAAAAALARFLPQEAASVGPAFTALLTDKNPAVRRQAATGLLTTKAASGAAATVLVKLVQDPNGTPEVRGEAARALARAGQHVAVARPVLVEALGDTSAFVRQAAAEALATVAAQDKAAVTALQARLDDGDAFVRVAAATALVANSAKNPKVLDVLRAGLKNSDRNLQQAVLTGLAGILVLPPGLDPVLEELALEPSPQIRRDAVLLLSAEYLRKE